ncbi:cysteine-rich receptor-like protein kinase 27 [Prunus avium]|uniref:Cysteine-rich receptor-like protein kinase 27 n=1 Tax=Prunus avium TaxID=42229 RepID=A0A6P5S7B5_PRUAV|nr:cysteine-rich receptor-like protein kinase 27 [Prunus avium]
MTIFGIKQEDPLKHVPSPNSAKNPQQFELVLTPLLGILRDRAASGDSLKKFAAGHATVPGGETIYALAQCTPDIDKQNCSNCLKESVSEIQTCCGGKQGGRVLKPSCNLRYEVSLFFRSTTDSLVDIPAPVPAAPAPKEAKKKSNIKQTVIIIVVVLVVFVTIFSSICFFFRVKKRRVKLEQDENSEDVGLVEWLQYDFETIRSATDDFSNANKLGRGGFGAVYRN